MQSSTFISAARLNEFAARLNNSTARLNNSTADSTAGLCYYFSKCKDVIANF